MNQLYVYIHLLPLGPLSLPSPPSHPSRASQSTDLSSLRCIAAYSHCGEQCGGSLKKLKIPHDTAVPLLDMHPEKAIIPKDTCIQMLTAALFINTVARTWKQPKL